MIYPCVSVEQVVGDFESYCDKIRRKRTILGCPSGEQISIPATSGSRYFLDGQKRIKAKLRKRLGADWQEHGVLLSLTYDGNGTLTGRPVPCVKAWELVGRHRREFMNKLWLWRRRHGLGKKPLGYLSVLEVQPGTGYPHVHVVFPRIYNLADKDDIARLWGHGMTHVEHADQIGPTAYICKYISKMEHWQPVFLAYLHNFGVRMYSVGRRFFLLRVKVYSPWFFVAQIITPPQAVVCLMCPDTS